MKHIYFSILIFAAALPLAAQTGFPFQDESLRYKLSGPGGVSLGTAALTARRAADGWDFEVSLNAGIPGFRIADRLQSSASASPEFCSAAFERDLNQGGRESREKIAFDQKAESAHRVTLLPDGGGQSDLEISPCARDAVAFAYFAREELGQGRMPPAQQVYFGSAYTVHMSYTGAEPVTSGGKPKMADHVVYSVKGPQSDFTFDVFYARDAARTPLEVRIPLALGAVSLDLVR